jgi:catechol 2,3-dioxygenase-like lactoylglutathione lyase family enzyme
MNRAMKFAIVAALCASLAWSQEVKRPRLTGVAHIALYAHDIDRSREFYTGFLGFQEPFSLKNPDGSLSMTFFKINDRQYVELLPETQAGTDRLSHIALETDDAAQMLAYLASRGVKTPARATRDRIGNASFDVTDPDGHTVEIVQYEPDGWSMREKGKFMNENRAANHMSHVGIIVASLEPALKFYRDILGCQEIWRGSQDGKYLSWVNMKVPDDDDWVEFMLYDQYPGLRQLGVFHHLGLIPQDMAKAAAIMEAQPGRKTYTRPLDLQSAQSRRQIQVYDPDGSRAELMPPASANRQSSTAPPIR